MKNPCQPVDISVIVPVYNVEEYLAECLDSLLRQGEVRLEVIMIDDGSTDSSGAIADQYAQEYDNFFCYHIENGGLGHARNYGVQYATGKYLIFLDSDDVIVDNAYEKMFTAAERSGSELTICNVARFNSKKTWPSALHDKVFQKIEAVSHITRNFNLINDTTSWNKLILRSFYLKHDFQFPENILYEDIPVTIPMHILANRVSMLSGVGYLWRVRDGATKSITQSVSDLKNLEDRIAILRMLDRFFEEQVTDRTLHEQKQQKALEVDLMIFVNACDSVPADQALEIMRMVNEYIDSAIDDSTFAKLSILAQQKYAYVRKYDLEGLIRVREYQRTKYSTAPVHERDGALYVTLPEDLFTVPERNITAEFARSLPRKYIDDMKVTRSAVKIFGHIYWRRFNLKDCSEQQISAWLYDEVADYRLPLEVIPAETKQLTAFFGTVLDADTGAQMNYHYDGTGFQVVVDLEKLEQGDCPSGVYRLLVSYQNRLFSGNILLSGIAGVLKGKYNHHSLVSGSSALKISFSRNDELQFVVNREALYLEQFSISDGQVVCELNQTASMLIAQDVEDEENKVLFETGDQRHFYAQNTLFGSNKRYWLYAVRSEENQSVLSRNQCASILDDGSRAAVLSSYRTNVPKVKFCDYLTQVTASKQRKSHLILSTATTGNDRQLLSARKARLCVRDTMAQCDVILASSDCDSASGHVVCRFDVNFGSDKIVKNFYQGTRDLFVVYQLPDGTSTEEPLFCTQSFSYEIKSPTLRIVCYRSMYATIRMQLTLLWPEAESSEQKRKLLTYENYPKYRQEPIHPRRILFESMWGTKYSCNPQALYEYIDRNYPEYECIWSLNDPRTPIKGRGIRVRRGSQEYYHYLATAKYLVNNVNFEDGYVKRPEQIEIQTMHGTPLKTLGLDVPGDFPTEASRAKYIEKNRRWNYLVVQGEFMAQRGKTCFEFEKDILRTGYPRTDKLYHATEAEISAIKERLELPKDKKIILYAPTWRVKNKFEMRMDLAKMREALSDEYILLVRLHHFSANGYRIPADQSFLYDFNSYQYGEDLYLIADLLITDYSSVMFDYALLRRPMLFFTYDLEEYCNDLRGLYVNFAEEAPGPLLRDTDEIIDTIRHLDTEMAKCKDRIDRFHQKFLTYECANSSEQIVREVLKPDWKAHWAYQIKKKLRPVKRKIKRLLKGKPAKK